MKKTCLLFFLLFAITATVIAQTTVEKNISYIRDQFRKINDTAAKLQPDTVELDISTEGAEVLVYKSNGRVIKLLLNAFGELGKSEEEYYFDSMGLIFAFIITYTYNRPIYWDKEKAKENGDTEWFDEKKTKRTENRYYFKEETLIRWIGQNKKIIPASDKRYNRAEIEVHEGVYTLMESIDTRAREK